MKRAEKAEAENKRLMEAAKAIAKIRQRDATGHPCADGWHTKVWEQLEAAIVESEKENK